MEAVKWAQLDRSREECNFTVSYSKDKVKKELTWGYVLQMYGGGALLGR